jgi:hypothetical protein
MLKIIGAAGVLALALLCCGGYYFGSEDTATCTVEDKDRSSSQSGSVYRVYTDCGVFEVEDAMLRGNFASADLYAELDTGGTYEFTTIGWRLPFLSMFPNIIDAVAVEDGGSGA